MIDGALSIAALIRSIVILVVFICPGALVGERVMGQAVAGIVVVLVTLGAGLLGDEVAIDVVVIVPEV